MNIQLLLLKPIKTATNADIIKSGDENIDFCLRSQHQYCTRHFSVVVMVTGDVTLLSFFRVMKSRS